MPNAARLKFTEDDQSLSAGDVPVAITAIQIEAVRGPIGRPDILVSSNSQYQQLYGGLSATSDDPLLAKRLLDGGTQLRINNVRHYTDPTDASTLSATYATNNNTDGAVALSITGTITTGNYTLAATGYTSGVVPFNTSALQTLKDLAAAFKLANPGKLYSAFAGLDAANGGVNTLYLTPVQGQTVASPAITGTGVLSTVAKRLGDFSRIISATNTPLFGISPIAQGAGYNPLIVDIQAASNGNANYFKIVLFLQGEESYTTETYDNILIEGSFTTSNLHFLDSLNASSNIAQGNYLDLSAIPSGTVLVPILGARTYSGGTDGGSVVDADYIGDSAGRTGFHAFDAIDDVVSLGAPNKSSAAIHIAGFAYATNRQDLVYFAHLSNSLTTANALVSAKDAMLVDSSFGGFYAGGLKVVDPLTSTTRNISELADVMAIAATSATNFGMQYSFASTKRGKVPNVLGVVTNFGTPGTFNDLNLLANHQINMVIVKDKVTQISGNFTAQLSNSLLSWMNVRRSIIFIKKTLAPLLQPFIEDPNNFKTWKGMYLAVKPFLDKCGKNDTLQGGEGVGWDWQGDQFAKSLDKLAINNRTDVNNGKYKVRLFLSPTPSMQQVEIVITIVGSTISISEILG